MYYDKMCKGCYYYSRSDRRPLCKVIDTDYVSETLICPCSICLIKGVCEDACDDYNYYVDELELEEYLSHDKKEHP